MTNKKLFEPDKPIIEGLDYFARKDLRQGWMEFIRKYDAHWSWIMHPTFRNPVHPESAFKMLSVFMNKLNCFIYGRKYYKTGRVGILVIVAMEKQQRDVIHFHMLIAGVPDWVRYSEFALWWNDKAGRCKIEPYDSQRGGADYLTKYITKDGDIQVLGNTALVETLSLI
jgi:hypothetical protein